MQLKTPVLHVTKACVREGKNENILGILYEPFDRSIYIYLRIKIDVSAKPPRQFVKPYLSRDNKTFMKSIVLGPVMTWASGAAKEACASRPEGLR
jgi:hypothetical protein